MDANLFRTCVERYNRKWLSQTINIPISTDKGIDLVDNEAGIEMKCRLNIYATNYAIHAYQIQEFKENNSEQELFWAFLTYSLIKPVSNIRQHERLSKLVKDMEAKIIRWEWITQFPISYPKTGPYVYAHSKDFPSDDYFRRYEKNNGIIYLPRNSILEEKINTPLKAESDAPF